jgi:hypothetical protein
MPPPAQTQPFNKPKLLAGEGQDEVFFFEALLAHLQISDVQVEQYAGKGYLAKYLRELPLRPGYQNVVAIGITRDADGNVAQTFQSVGGLLGNAGLPTPAAAGQVTAGPPRVGVFLMPDNQRPGMLEDLCLDAVQSDGAISCVTDYFKCVDQRAKRQPNNMAKARVHAWLASQLEPDRRLGEAAKAGIWPWHDAAFAPLIQFLQAL